MELYEKGLLNDPLLKFGNTSSLKKIVEKIANK
jgi:aldehyde:ferredoxin oxidoreductase